MVRNILEYLEASATEYGDKTAFVDENTELTFSELRRKAESIGSAICELQNDKRPVPVFMEKSANEIAAFMGVVYSGNAYVPIDPQMPEKRIERILATLKAEVIIVDCGCEEIVSKISFDGRIVLFDTIKNHAVDRVTLDGIRRKSIDCDLLYVIFTSGSTGYPKGVAVNHRAVIDFVEWYAKIGGLDSSCVFGNQAPFYFDVSVKDIYSTLKNGATTYIIPIKLFAFPVELFNYIVDNEINTIAWSVSAISLSAKDQYFLKTCPHTLKRVYFGGEAMPIKLLDVWRKYLPDAMYMNMYGPTEITVDCTYYIIEDDRDYAASGLPIGFPCENTDILILNGDHPVQNGEIGEICVRGTSLANGYYYDLEKTKGAFVQNPLQKAFPELIYRTGDNGYYNEKGEIMFASRKDDQIKHMGYRIELGEIETALSEVEGIFRCCCLYDVTKDKIVCVYTGRASKKEIILELGRFVPKYMWPNVFIQLAEMPLNLNGKIDRVKLKAEYANG